MSPETEVKNLLHQHGAKLIRSKTHRIYQFPNGRIYSTSHRPSNIKAELREIRMVLGINPPKEGAQGCVKSRQPKPGNQARPRITPAGESKMAIALRASGVVEASLRDKLLKATLELRSCRQALHRKKRQLRQMEKAINRLHSYLDVYMKNFEDQAHKRIDAEVKLGRERRRLAWLKRCIDWFHGGR